MATLESFYDRIQRLRVARGLSERELAERIGITVRQYQLAVRSGARPTCALLIDVAAAFDVSVNELMERTIEAPPTLEQLRVFRHELLSRRAAIADRAERSHSVERRLARVHEALAADTELEPDTLTSTALVLSVERNDTLRTCASRYVRLVVQRCGGNRTQARLVLGINHQTLRKYLRYPPDSDRTTMRVTASDGGSSESPSKDEESTALVQ